MESRLYIYVSLAADILIAIFKFIAAGITGSSSMLSEAIHSVIDAISQLLLILGISRSKKRPDERRPFGYGKEMYFWSFIVSLIIFLLGGCISFYEGWLRTREPDFKGSPYWSYTVLAIAFVFNSITMATALKVFNRQRGDTPFFKAVRESKDPPTFIVLLGDVIDLLGLVVAFMGVYLGLLFRHPYYDGIASMIIGLLLIAASMLLACECKSLLMGETIKRKTMRKIVAIAEADEAITKVKKQFSMYLAPEEILLQMLAVFKKDLTTEQLTNAIERITKAIKTELPKIRQIYIEPVK